MQLAVHADSPVYDFSPSHSTSTRRSTKFMVAGVAMASAGVIAVSPISPPMPTIQDVQERVTHAAVQLTAATNPLVVWQQSIANTIASLETLTEGAIAANTNLFGALSTGYIFQEVANIFIQNTLNPGPLLNEILGFNERFGPVINLAIKNTVDRLTTAAEQMPQVFTDALTFLSQGQFVEAFSEVNGWFVLRILGGIRPLIPILSIPAQFVGALPGAEKLPVLLDVISEFALTKAIFEPILGGILQSAEVLDAARAALVAGNFVDAATNLVNLPVLALNALVNGFTPAGGTAEWQGLIDRGVITYLTVTLPNQIANAIKPPVNVNAFSAKSTLAPQAPTEYSFGGKTYTFENGSLGVADNAGAGAGAGDGSGDGDGTGAGAGAGDGSGDGDGTGDDNGTGEDGGEDNGDGDNGGEDNGTGEDGGEDGGEDNGDNGDGGDGGDNGGGDV